MCQAFELDENPQVYFEKFNFKQLFGTNGLSPVYAQKDDEGLLDITNPNYSLKLFNCVRHMNTYSLLIKKTK